MVASISQTSSLHLLTPGASVSWPSSITWRATAPLGRGLWALWKGTWRGCCSWSGARFRPPRRRVGNQRRQMLHPAATGQLQPSRHASALRSASSSASVPSPSHSSHLWPATLTCSPAVPAPCAASATPPVASRAAAPPTATPVSPGWVPLWSTGGLCHSPKGATARAGCTAQTGALHHKLRGSAALWGPTATWGECRPQETSAALFTVLTLSLNPPPGTVVSRLGWTVREHWGMCWTTGQGSSGRGAAQSRDEAEQKDSKVNQRKDEAVLSTGEEELSAGEQRSSRNGK